MFAKYRGPVFHAAPVPPDPPAASEPPAGAAPAAASEEGHLYSPPPPPTAAPPGYITRPDTSSYRRRFETGPLLSETFATYFANFVPFLLLTAVAYSPVVLLAFLVPSGSEATSRISSMLLNGGSWLCTPLAQAVVAYGVLQHMRARDTTIGDCLRVGLATLVPVFLVALLQGLLVFLGTLLCFVPGIILSVMYAVAVPAAVEERPGPVAALRRSSELTDGYRWQVFFVTLALGLLGAAFVLLAMPFAGGFEALSAMRDSGSTTYVLLSHALGIVPFGLTATAGAVMYYRLRSLKESIDVEELASIFD